MTTAVDKWPAAAKLVAVAAAGHLPTAPTPPQGARPRWGSRSAPIGTPANRVFPDQYKCLRPHRGWGPNWVLKHTLRRKPGHRNSNGG